MISAGTVEGALFTYPSVRFSISQFISEHWWLHARIASVPVPTNPVPASQFDKPRTI